MIYAILAVGTNFVKFGKANNVARRLANHQISCPHELKVIAQCEWPDAEEFKIHTYLAPEHVRGEWFDRGNRANRVLALMRDPENGANEWQRLKMKNAVESRYEYTQSRLAKVIQFANEYSTR